MLADPANSFPAGVHAERGGIAVRVTSHPVTRALVERLGRPLTSTSANFPGDPPATSGDEALGVARARGDVADRVWVLDAGTLPPSPASTVVDCTSAVARVLRPGATPLHRLRCVLPEIDGER